MAPQGNVARGDSAQVAGTIRSSDGLPISGTIAVAYRRDPENGGWFQVREEVAGQTGGYSMDLEPGEYRFFFFDPSGTFASQYYPEAESWGSAATIRVPEDTLAKDSLGNIFGISAALVRPAELRAVMQIVRPAATYTPTSSTGQLRDLGIKSAHAAVGPTATITSDDVDILVDETTGITEICKQVIPHDASLTVVVRINCNNVTRAILTSGSHPRKEVATDDRDNLPGAWTEVTFTVPVALLNDGSLELHWDCSGGVHGAFVKLADIRVCDPTGSIKTGFAIPTGIVVELFDAGQSGTDCASSSSPPTGTPHPDWATPWNTYPTPSDATATAAVTAAPPVTAVPGPGTTSFPRSGYWTFNSPSGRCYFVAINVPTGVLGCPSRQYRSPNIGYNVAKTIDGLDLNCPGP